MGTNCGKHLCKGKHDCGSCNQTKHGKWLLVEAIYGHDKCKCSVCGQVWSTPKGERLNYCPNCGAKMDLEAENV